MQNIRASKARTSVLLLAPQQKSSEAYMCSPHFTKNICSPPGSQGPTPTCKFRVPSPNRHPGAALDFYSLVLFSRSCLETLVRWNRTQLHVQDSKYGGTPLHWTKDREVRTLLCSCVVRKGRRYFGNLFMRCHNLLEQKSIEEPQV